MSWLSEWVRWATGNPKVPAVIQCQRLETRRVLVIGQNALIELVARTNGTAQFIMSDGASIANAVTITRKPGGEINIDLVGPDKAVKGAVDMAQDGSVVVRLPKPSETPTPPPAPPDGPATPGGGP